MIDKLFELMAINRWLFFFLFIAGLIIFIEVGRWLGRRRRAVIGMGQDEGASLVVGSLLGLLAFVLALNLSNASSRHDRRMTATLEEVNAISTAINQAEAVGGTQADALVSDLKEYLALRHTFLRAAPGDALIAQSTAETDALQGRIWARLTQLIEERPTPPVTSLMNALTDTFDATTAMRMAMEYKMPTQVVYLLLVMSLMGTAAVGYQFGLTKRRGRIPGIVVSVLWAVVITQIIDIGTARIWTFRTQADVYEWTMDSVGVPTRPAGT